MVFADILTILVDGVVYASWLFIVALGLTLIFGVLQILNLAHGSLYAVGAYAAATFTMVVPALGLPPAFSLLAMLIAAIAVAVVSRRSSNADCYGCSMGATRC